MNAKVSIMLLGFFWLASCVSCFLAGRMSLPDNNSVPDETNIEVIDTYPFQQPATRAEMLERHPWKPTWSHEQIGQTDVSIVVEDRSLFSPSQYNLHIYSRDKKTNRWVLRMAIPDVVGGPPIEPKSDAAKGIIEFIQADKTIASYDLLRL